MTAMVLPDGCWLVSITCHARFCRCKILCTGGRGWGGVCVWGGGVRGGAGLTCMVYSKAGVHGWQACCCICCWCIRLDAC